MYTRMKEEAGQNGNKIRLDKYPWGVYYAVVGRYPTGVFGVLLKKSDEILKSGLSGNCETIKLVE